MSMEYGEEWAKPRLVQVVGEAGSNIARMITNELIRRGYTAVNAEEMKRGKHSVMNDIKNIIFTSREAADKFKKAGIIKQVIDIPEVKKEKAVEQGEINGIRAEIREKLDKMGFADTTPYKIGQENHG